MYKINVLEQARFGVPAQPQSTIQIGDYFICPNCQDMIPITYWDDSRGKHPDISLKCPKCGKIYGILF